MATLKVREVFPLPSRRKFVVAGDILGGALKAGMFAQLCAAQVLVKSIEYVDRVSAGEPMVGLVFSETDTVNAVTSSKSCPAGSVLEVNDAA